MVIEKNILKFKFANYINILSYPKYSEIFNNITAIEKVIIVCTYYIISIIKLRSSSSSFILLYYQIQDYIIVLLQNLGP